MTIAVGATLPSVSFKYFEGDEFKEGSTDQLFQGRKVVLFAVPGAFTPTCSVRHLPGFLEQAAALKAKGVDAIVVTAVNDPFVFRAWLKDTGATDTLTPLPDGNATLATALGLTLDGSGFGLGTRSQRYSLIAEDGVVTWLAVEPNPAELTVASAEEVLKAL